MIRFHPPKALCKGFFSRASSPWMLRTCSQLCSLACEREEGRKKEGRKNAPPAPEPQSHPSGHPRSSWALLKLLLSVPWVSPQYFMQENQLCLLQKAACGSKWLRIAFPDFLTQSVGGIWISGTFKFCTANRNISLQLSNPKSRRGKPSVQREVAIPSEPAMPHLGHE